MPSSIPPPLHAPILLAGPTAVGKSEVALLLAEQLGGEIVSVDSMQVYRGLDIGTAKPSADDQKRVPHHLIDLVEVTEAFDAAQFAQRAHRAVAEIQARGRVPILCGGTGLYFRAFLEGLGDAPPADLPLREELERTPMPDLLKELEASDRVTFETIDRKNPRRVIRALEVIRLTGKPFSVQRAAWARRPEPAASTRPVFCLDRAAVDLHARIDTRVDQMFERRLLEETRDLLARGLAGNRTALQAIGYRQVIEHLSGQRPVTETIALVKLRTRQFTKRQRTWFRRQMRAEWLAVEPRATPGEVAERLIGLRRGA